LIAIVLVALLRAVIVFDEPGFPAADVAQPIPSVRADVVTASGDELAAALRSERGVLVWRHGSTFPVETWPALVRFLEAGGSLLVLGGEPFTRPVRGPAGQRVVGPRTLSMLRELRLDRCRTLDARGAAVRFPAAGTKGRPLPGEARVTILEPRLSDTRDFASEDGAPGARDGIVRSLAFLDREGDDPRFPFASAAFAIDRLRGRFAGGRWSFWLPSVPPTDVELRSLLTEAERPPVDFRVDPTFACFHEGESPSMQVRIHRPRAAGRETLAFTLRTTGPGTEGKVSDVKIDAGTHAAVEVPLDVSGRPGLYRVEGTMKGAEPFETGFWILDRDLFASGAELSFDGFTMRRGDTPEPVVGTTVMSRSVHRKFLFEPNAAEWDDTFAELASIGVNLVRTGVWSAYRKISLDPNVVDEAWLRALEAYYLTARRHGIPVVFTFFAFVPEDFGGANPYLDPRAIEGQQAYLATVARRFRAAKEILWDLINEPSFSSPDKLWRCRPNGDRFESEAFVAWLREEFGEDWEATVRARWRLAPDEPIGLPTDDDFEDRHVFGEHRPYRAMDWVRFAQDAFAGWIREMTRAIRDAGSDAPITVGQDEGGLGQRPGPLFHHRAVDFTSIHTWWYNDALLWDGLMAKAAGKPLLVSETGVMQRELLSGEPLRDPDEAARLLSRKIGHAFASGAFGVVQWCYDVNPYMASDNEAAIGLRRPDGSYKPEHRILREFASFVRRNRERFESPAEPEVVLVLAAGDHFAPRGTQMRATRRAVELLVAALGVPVRVVPEYRTAADLGSPRAIVLPSCRGISDAAWRDLEAAVRRGSRLLASGWMETDDAGLSAERFACEPRPLALVEPLTGREPGPAPAPRLRYSLDLAQSWFACAHEEPVEIPLGKGSLVHLPLPIEWADPDPVQETLYRAFLDSAGVAGGPVGRAGVLVRRIEFRDAALWVVVNETSAAFRLPPPPSAPDVRPPMTVPAGESRLLFVDREGRVLDRSHD
jgi:hypothetical protein